MSLSPQLRGLLNIPDEKAVSFERFSDSAGAYISLDASNSSAYRTLFRAAKAKQKLRLRASVPGEGISLNAVDLASIVDAGQPPRVSMAPRLAKLALNPAFSSSEATLNNPTGAAGVPRVPATKPAAVDDGEAPVPKPFSARDRESAVGQIPLRAALTGSSEFFSELANVSRARE
ncbi:MAG: hypothetical protein INR71_10800, partial [Terriglobus roseus]|nr:hypothetical protein [Terriglobus roseus]